MLIWEDKLDDLKNPSRDFKDSFLPRVAMNLKRWVQSGKIKVCDLKMPLWEFKILHIFEIPSSSRRGKHYQTLEILFVVFHHSINIPWIEKLTIQNWNLQGFKIIYSTQLQVHWISVLILTSWCITKDLKQGLLKLKIAAANYLESTKTTQRYVKAELL